MRKILLINYINKNLLHRFFLQSIWIIGFYPAKIYPSVRKFFNIKKSIIISISLSQQCKIFQKSHDSPK